MMLLKLKVPVFCLLFAAVFLQVTYSRPWGNDDSDFNRYEVDEDEFEEEIPELSDIEPGLRDSEEIEEVEDEDNEEEENIDIFKRELEDESMGQPEIINEFEGNKDDENDEIDEERKIEEEIEEEAKEEIEKAEEEAKEEDEEKEEEEEKDESEFNDEEGGKNDRDEGPLEEEIEEKPVEEHKPEEDAEEEEVKLEAEIHEEENDIRGEFPPWGEPSGPEETFEEVPQVDNDEDNTNYTIGSGDEGDDGLSPPRRFYHKIRKYIKNFFSG